MCICELTVTELAYLTVAWFECMTVCSNLSSSAAVHVGAGLAVQGVAPPPEALWTCQTEASRGSDAAHRLTDRTRAVVAGTPAAGHRGRQRAGTGRVVRRPLVRREPRGADVLGTSRYGIKGKGEEDARGGGPGSPAVRAWTQAQAGFGLAQPGTGPAWHKSGRGM